MANFGHLLAQFPSRKHSNLTMGLDVCSNNITRYQIVYYWAVDLAIRYTYLFIITTQRDNRLISRVDKSFIENCSTTPLDSKVF